MTTLHQQDRQPTQKRVLELDGIRGCAILLVLIWHYGYCQISQPDSNVLLRWLNRNTGFTWCGVDLFFVLSGFLIGGILLDHRESRNYFPVFYARRICRIFPLYFLLVGSFVLAVSLGIQGAARFNWLFDNPMPIFTYLTFTQNIAMGFAGDLGCNWLGVTWSLAIEEQFYLIIPIAVYFLPRKYLVVLSLGLIVIIPYLRSLPTNPITVFTNILWRADALLSGLLLAILVRNKALMEVLRSRRKFFDICFLALFATTWIIQPPPNQSIYVYSWMSLLSTLFILAAVIDKEGGIAKALRSSFLVWFGNRSYAIYMFHQLICGLIHGLFGNGTPSIDTSYGFILTLAALGFTLLLSDISYHTYERWFLNYARRFSYEKTTP